MRRLARLFFTLCSAALLLLCVAVCVLWAGSFVRPHVWMSPHAEVRSDAGRLTYRDESPWPPHNPTSWPQFLPVESGRFPGFGWDVTRIQFADGPGGPVEHVIREAWAAHWLLAGLTWAIPLAWAARRRRERRLRNRLQQCRCPVCGYDLRASLDHCPECGAAVTGTGAGEPEKRRA